MSKITYNTMSGMELEMRRQEILANNLAAVSVPGFKSEFLVSSPTPNSGDGNDPLCGVKSGSIKVDFEQGEVKNTGRRLDFALQGKGFFQVSSEDGKTMYTRNGAFKVTSDFKLVTDQGFAVMNETGGEIVFLPQDDLSNLEVGADGTLKIRGDATQGYAYRTVGKLKVQQISNLTEMERLTGSYYRMNAGVLPKEFTDPKPEFVVSNGMLEESNVSAMKTMTMLIQSSRDFEMCNKIMRMLTEMGNSERQTFGS